MRQVGTAERVSAAEFIRGFANWRLHSAREPVVVTHHGKDAHVLLSLDAYERLGHADVATSANRLKDSQIMLLESVRDSLILLDREQRIVAINPAAADLLDSSASAVAGQALTDAIPSIEASLLYPHLVRMIDHRERFSGDLPALLRPGQWLQADLVPLPVGGAIILRDISGTVAAREADDARQAAVRAIDVDGAIGHARISVRENVEYANPALTAMVGVDEAAIRRVRFSAMMPLPRRQHFTEELEGVFRTGTAAKIETELVSREGALLAVTLSIVERRSSYASEGATILVTPRSTHDPMEA